MIANPIIKATTGLRSWIFGLSVSAVGVAEGTAVDVVDIQYIRTQDYFVFLIRRGGGRVGDCVQSPAQPSKRADFKGLKNKKMQ